MRTLAHIIIFIVIHSATYGQAPTPTPCDHQSNSIERFEKVRLTPPVRVLNYDGRELSVQYRDAKTLEIWSFYADKDSVVHLDGDWKTVSVWILFCVADHHIYTVVPLTTVQRRGLK